MMYGGPVEDLGGMAGACRGRICSVNTRSDRRGNRGCKISRARACHKRYARISRSAKYIAKTNATAAVMGKGPAMGGIKPIRNPLAGPASGVASAIGSLGKYKIK